MAHPLTDADCKQILKDNPHVWEYGEDPTLLVNELMRAAYDKGCADRLEQVIRCLEDDFEGVFWRDDFMSKFKKAMRPQEES